MLGVVIGYIITALFNIAEPHSAWMSWRCSFYLQFLVLIGTFGVIYNLKEEELDTNGILSKDKLT